MTVFSPEQLGSFMEDVFVALGVTRTDAAICADVLLQADLYGFDTHGAQRLNMYYDRIRAGIYNPHTQIEVVSDKDSVVVLDGHVSLGHVVAHTAMNMAIEKAKKYGLGAVAVRNSTHFGIAGYYADMAVHHDMIGIVTTNARPSIAPTHGVEPMLGTNPLTCAAPTDEAFPFLLDAATSIIQRGTVELYERLHQVLPEGLVVNTDGKSETDPATILKKLTSNAAALLPIGGYKGYGYATFVEILSSALQQGIFLKDTMGVAEQGKTLLKVGHFFLAIHVAHFIDPLIFKTISGSIMRGLRASQKEPASDRIYTAGEKEYEMKMQRLEHGIPLDDSIVQDLRRIRDELKLSAYTF